MFRCVPTVKYWLAVFSALTTLLVCFRLFFLAVVTVNYALPLNTELLHAVSLGIRFDLRLACLLSLPVLLLFFVFRLLCRFRTGRVHVLCAAPLYGYIAITVFALTLLYILDFYYFTYLQERLNASVFRFSTNVVDSAVMVWESYPVVWVGIVAILVTFGVSAVLAYAFGRLINVEALKVSKPARLATDKVYSKKQTFAYTMMTLVVIYFSLMGKLTSIVPLRWSEAFASQNPNIVAVALNPVLFLYDTSRYAESAYDPEVVKKFVPVIKAYLGWPDNVSPLTYDSVSTEEVITPAPFARKINPPALHSAASAPNVIFIHLESLGANRMATFGNPLKATEFLDYLANEGTIFTNFYVPSIGTAKSIFALLTGIPDVSLVKTATRNPFAVDQFVPINAAKSYEKYYFLGGSANWAQVRGLLTHNIDDLHLFEEGDWQSETVDVWGISDYSLFKESAAHLGKAKQPFMAFVQTAGNHGPYTIPEEDNGFTQTNVSEEAVKAAGFTGTDQFQATRLLDHNLKQFFEMAKAQGFYDNTLFVLYGDHNGPRLETRFPTVDTLTGAAGHHVPLVLYYTGKQLTVPLPPQVDAPAGLVDVIPTVLSLIGIAHELRAFGRDQIVSPPQRPHAFLFDSRDKLTPLMSVMSNNFFITFQANGDIFKMSPLNTQAQLIQADIQSAREWSLGVYALSNFLFLNNKRFP